LKITKKVLKDIFTKPFVYMFFLPISVVISIIFWVAFPVATILVVALWGLIIFANYDQEMWIKNHNKNHTCKFCEKTKKE